MRLIENAHDHAHALQRRRERKLLDDSDLVGARYFGVAAHATRRLGPHRGRGERVEVLGLFLVGLVQLPLGELEHFAVERVARYVAVDARYRVAACHGLQKRRTRLRHFLRIGYLLAKSHLF